MKKKLLWLDDYRDPFDKKVDWLVFSPIGKDVELFWVKSYDEFTNWIIENDLPDAICFDHDLNDIHNSDGAFKEKTGYDAAKWLIEYCDINEKEVPKYNVQSANTVGKENIISYIENYKKHTLLF